MQAVLSRQKGVTVPAILVYTLDGAVDEKATSLALRERKRTIIQHAVFCEECFGKNQPLYIYVTYKDIDPF